MKRIIQTSVIAFAVIFGASFWLDSIRANNAPIINANSSLTESDVKALYDNNCAKCHGKDGRAKSFRGKLSGAKNLTDPKWQEETKDENISDAITNGRGSMPAFKKLSEDEVKALVGYVRSFKK